MRRVIYAGLAAVLLLAGVPGQAVARDTEAVRMRRRRSSGTEAADEGEEDASSQMEEVNRTLTTVFPEDWYRTCYEVFVYSFADSNGDGIGDLPGLTGMLDYINDADPSTFSDLECTQIWTLPIFPSPTYHKYDVTDFLAVDPDYGTMEDFDAFVAACHERGIRLILDVPFNHTSTLHPWFAEAAEYVRGLAQGEEPSAADCRYVDYYCFSRDPQEGYEPLPDSSWYYEARFWSGMPDLNLDNGEVREEIRQIAAFWLDRGADGFRLDAVTSYYTGYREKNIAFLSWLNGTVKEIRGDAYLVGEAWENQASYSQYYASGVDSFFDFAFSGADGTIASVVKGSKKASAYAGALAQEEMLYASVSKTAINAPFYTNHDMARSAGYYSYDDGSRTKLAGALNLLMTGNAYVYYGEELGMKGSGRDENKRAPMYWISEEEKAAGLEGAEAYGSLLCDGPPEMDSVRHKFGSFLAQEQDDRSVWNYYRNAIRLRNAYPVIARGRTEVIGEMSGKNTAAFLRLPAGGDDCVPVLIVVNTSQEARSVKLADRAAEYTRLGGVLAVSHKRVELSEGILTLPPFGIALLVKESGGE